MEALADGGVLCGLPRDKALRYAAQMLRGTAALVIAALSAQGVSQVHDLRYIRRGYDGLERDLAALGAEIRIEP